MKPLLTGFALIGLAMLAAPAQAAPLIPNPAPAIATILPGPLPAEDQPIQLPPPPPPIDCHFGEPRPMAAPPANVETEREEESTGRRSRA